MKTFYWRQESLKISTICYQTRGEKGKRQKAKGKSKERRIVEIFAKNSPILQFFHLFLLTFAFLLWFFAEILHKTAKKR